MGNEKFTKGGGHKESSYFPSLSQREARRDFSSPFTLQATLATVGDRATI
jgi:hypothetical protein